MKRLALRLLLKYLLIPIIILTVILFLVFAPAAGEVDAYVPMEMSRTTVAPTRESVYTAYATVEKEIEETKTTVSFDVSDIYVDAKEVVGDSTGKEISNQISTGMPVYDGPSRERTEHAFVVNCKALMDNYYSQIIELTKEMGMSPSYSDPGEATYDYYVSNHAFTLPPQESVNNSKYSLPSGAIAPAIVCRDYFADQRYLEGGGDWFWGWFGTDYLKKEDAYIDIMVVRDEDWEAYYAGDAVEVLYIPYRVTDAKGHAYPWGAAQTYIGLSGPKGYYVYTGNSSGSNTMNSSVKIGSYGGDFVKELASYMKSIPSGYTQYWWPFLTSNNALSSVSNKATANSATGCQVEPYTNKYGYSLCNFLSKDSGYTVVGYLVYALQDNHR